jgi:hypothetical protein
MKLYKITYLSPLFIPVIVIPLSHKRVVIIGAGVFIAAAFLFWYRYNIYKGYNDQANSATATSVYRNTHKEYTLPMNNNTVEIKSGETVTIGDLVITSNGGGHKILESEGGGRGGDMSFAQLYFETPRKAQEEIRILSSLESIAVPVAFDNYLIQTKGVGWNGETVKLEVSLLPEGIMVTMLEGEIKKMGNMTVAFKKGNIPGPQKTYVHLELSSTLNSMSDAFAEGQSVCFAGNLIQVKKVNVNTREIELEVVRDVYKENASTPVSD